MPAEVLARAMRAYVRHAPGTAGKALLVGRLLDHRLRTHPVSAVVRLRTGDRVSVSTGDVIQRYQYLFGEWEPHLSAFLRDRLRPGDTFVDVGAHRGAFTLLASRAVGPHGRVVAIEPTPDYHRDLVAALAANGRANVRTIRSAASDVAGELTLYLEDPANLGHTTSVRPGHAHAAFQVPAAQLADLLTESEIASARVIKIDVEGAEAAAVRGLLPALSKLRANAELVIEVTPRLMSKQGETVETLLDALREHGFHVYRLTNDYDPATYPQAMRRPQPPVRCTEVPNEMIDLVFSREDLQQLGSASAPTFP